MSSVVRKRRDTGETRNEFLTVNLYVKTALTATASSNHVNRDTTLTRDGAITLVWSKCSWGAMRRSSPLHATLRDGVVKMCVAAKCMKYEGSQQVRTYLRKSVKPSGKELAPWKVINFKNTGGRIKGFSVWFRDSDATLIRNSTSSLSIQKRIWLGVTSSSLNRFW